MNTDPKSISAPPPAVVPLEDVRPLVEALTEMGNSCSRFEMWVIAKEALATFTAKRPLDAIAWMPLPDMPKSLVTGKDGKQSCAYCNKLIKPGQPTVPDEFGEPGARMHIGCDAADQDGQDLDRDHGDS